MHHVHQIRFLLLCPYLPPLPMSSLPSSSQRLLALEPSVPPAHLLCLLLRLGGGDLATATDARRTAYMALLSAAIQRVPCSVLDPCWEGPLGTMVDAQR